MGERREEVEIEQQEEEELAESLGDRVEGRSETELFSFKAIGFQTSKRIEREREELWKRRW